FANKIAKFVISSYYEPEVRVLELEGARCHGSISLLFLCSSQSLKQLENFFTDPKGEWGGRVKRRLWNDMSDVETLTSFHRNIPNKNERIDLDSINNEPQTYRHIDGIIIDNIAEEEADVRIPIFHNAYKTPKPLKRIFIKPRRRSTTTLSTTMTPFMDAMTTSGTHPKQPQTYRHIDGIIIDNIAEEEADVRIPIFHNAYKTPKPLKRIFIKPRRRSTTTLSTTMTPFMDAMTTSGTHPKQVSEDDIDLVAVCERVKSIAQNYRIRDMPKFARNNCVLIRFYYPNASCTDIITIVSEDDIDLVAVCERVKSIAQNYRIRDMPKFARNNCVLIRFYYPNASCTDIITIVDYCFPEYAAAFA
uniref:THUMP domain-containing protein n=1 Tax=Ascaris lumbricoides TaxID=6252 RepID=A0A0M3I6I0_ASCLU